MTPATGVPGTVDTARLTLRPHVPADLAECAAMWGDPVVTRQIGGRPATAEEVWARVLRYAGLWSLLGYGYWVVRERASGTFVGEVGFADYQREITPSFANVPEVGWALTPRMHGRGYATEAVRAALTWGDAHLPPRPDVPTAFGAARTVCMITPENAASIRVAEKCDYTAAARTTYKERDVIVFGR